MVIFDTNILVRLITRDVESLYKKSVELIRKVEKGQEIAIVPVLVINELVWILKTFYSLDKRDFVPQVLKFLSLRNVRILEIKKSKIVDALNLMLEKNLDFTDCYLLQIQGNNTLATFDKKLKALSIWRLG